MHTEYAAVRVQSERTEHKKILMFESDADRTSSLKTIRRLLSPVHDEHMMAASAAIFPGTIQKLLTGKPVAPVTAAKVFQALAEGRLEPKPLPAADADLASRLHRFLILIGGTSNAAAALHVSPLVVAKLIYGRAVNTRFRDAVRRRLDKIQATPKVFTNHGVFKLVAPAGKAAVPANQLTRFIASVEA